MICLPKLPKHFTYHEPLFSLDQMNASNLAVCFTPTVFQLGRSGSGSPASPKRGRKLGGSNSNPPGTPDPREIMEQKAAHECLHMLITECKTLFTVNLHFLYIFNERTEAYSQGLCRKEVATHFLSEFLNCISVSKYT